jgi:2-iminobutanoate/2-iminopropanoate deaminase
MKKPRNPDVIHGPLGAYSHQIEVVGAQRWLVMAGQVGRTTEGIVPEDPIEQVAAALENVRRNLQAAGMDVTDLVKLTWYLVGDIDTARRREVTAAWLNGHEPCSTLVYVVRLAAPEYRVEIDAWACQDAAQGG